MYLIIEGVVVIELRADLGDEREVLETRELAGRHCEDTYPPGPFVMTFMIKIGIFITNPCKLMNNVIS